MELAISKPTMKLNEIQQKLKAPKSQYNSFGKYAYRNVEDILEALKPLLGDSVLTISDEIVNVGDRYYVKATADFYEPGQTNQEGEHARVTAYAREALDRKGMDDSQITGAASSYARKYALNGLFLIDDTKDADSDENEKAPVAPKTAHTATAAAKPDAAATAAKKRIVELLEEHDGAISTSKEANAKRIKELSGLDPSDEGNLIEIISRLETLKEIE